MPEPAVNFDLKTTEQAFGKQLHIYTIVDAIADGNVLPFRVDYVSTMREQENIKDEQVRNIDASVRWQLLPVSVVLQTTYWNISTKRLTRNARSFTFNKLVNIAEMATAKNREATEEKKQKTRMTGFNSISPFRPLTPQNFII